MSFTKLWGDAFFLDMVNETPKSLKRSNVITNEDDYRVQISVPGLTKDDIKISVDNSIIKISHEKEDTDEKTFFFTHSFEKSYRLPDDVDDKKIEGKIENGILEVIIPRSKKKISQRFIEIK